MPSRALQSAMRLPFGSSLLPTLPVRLACVCAQPISREGLAALSTHIEHTEGQPLFCRKCLLNGQAWKRQGLALCFGVLEGGFHG